MEKHFCLVLVIILLVSGCATQKELVGSGVTREAGITKEYLKSVLSKASNIHTYQYDLVSMSESGKMEVKVYYEEPKWRTKGKIESFKTIDGSYESESVYDGQFLYVYSPYQNMYFKSSEYKNFENDIKDNAKLILDQFIEGSQVLGRETVDNKQAIVMEFTADENAFSSLPKTGVLNTYKWWIWEDNGVTLKSEVFDDKGKSVSVSEFKNIKFDDIPDSIFTVPQEKVLELQLPSTLQ